MKGLRVVLKQDSEKGVNHPVAYASCTLSKHENNYGITDLEALGVVWALRHFRVYLLDHACVLIILSTLRSVLCWPGTSQKIWLDGVR